VRFVVSDRRLSQHFILSRSSLHKPAKTIRAAIESARGDQLLEGAVKAEDKLRGISGEEAEGRRRTIFMRLGAG